MPAGSRGKSAKVRYITDTNRAVAIRVPQYMLDAGKHGLQPTDGTELAKPDGLKPRVVFWEGTITEGATGAETSRKIRRSIPCNPAAVLFNNDARLAHDLDGVAGTTTGRRGERVSFA